MSVITKNLIGDLSHNLVPGPDGPTPETEIVDNLGNFFITDSGDYIITNA